MEQCGQADSKAENKKAKDEQSLENLENSWTHQNENLSGRKKPSGQGSIGEKKLHWKSWTDQIRRQLWLQSQKGKTNDEEGLANPHHHPNNQQPEEHEGLFISSDARDQVEERAGTIDEKKEEVRGEKQVNVQDHQMMMRIILK